ncbi:hypothetical protein OUZ56_003074 [Daphnia magna]|uniref:Uncharacterized protein n=1 Tax=Daphnia magna TaxID=35525 RepID=A0ABR0A7V3_9CRUS|nr:hypothetical protein OUZ56_003074 [Daphnia magna]
MVSVKKSTLMKYAAVAASLLAIGSIVGVIVMGISNMEYQMKTDLKTSTMNGCPTTDQSLPDVATAYNPPLRTSDPDLKLAVETISLTESNIYDSSVKKPDINTRKLEGKIFSLNGFFKNDGDDDSGSIHFSHETIPALDEEMVHLLSAIVSRGSHPEIKANVKTKKSLELEEKMMKLMTSIISRETNTMDRGKMVETLTSIVLEHGIDPDIKGKMTDVLSHIVNKIHKTNPEVELEMVKLISEVITQDTDEESKSPGFDLDEKSEMVYMFTKLTEEIKTPREDLDLKSEMVRSFTDVIGNDKAPGNGEEDYISDNRNVISNNAMKPEMVHTLLQRTKKSSEEDIHQQSEMTNWFSRVTQAIKTLFTDFDEKSEMMKILLEFADDDETAKKQIEGADFHKTPIGYGGDSQY